MIAKPRLSFWAFVILIPAFVIPFAHAHPSDISYLRVKVERQRVELRFTFNLLSLTRFVAIDLNQDRKIERTELDAAAAALTDYFNQHIELNINEQKTALGQARPFECVWPETDGSSSVAETDYPVRYVDITFMHEVKPVLADLWLNFDIWQQTGPLGTIEATYEQDDLRTQVPFSQGEPDYLYDTGYAVEDVFQEPVVKDAPPKDKTFIPPTWVLPIVELFLLIVFVEGVFRFVFPRKKP
ncbi:MAG: hypothetical protein NTV80_17870 [Verrucomicrobia bacterium]|nr:hypothetical protein [Verrucomicrobiota bacterium]